MKRHLISLFILVLLLIIIVNSIGSFISLRNKGSRIKEREAALEEEKQKHDSLTRKLLQVQSQDYIEKQAREKLNMAKEGDYVVVLPGNVTRDTGTVQGNSDSHFVVSPWQEWFHLFF